MFSKNAETVLEKRYLFRDESGQVVETTEGLLRRVARAVATAEGRWGCSAEGISMIEERFYQLMAQQRFLPNSPTLMNAGKDHGQLSACFVLPVPDTLDGIFETCKNAALIHKTGGGTGFSFNRLRPANDRVATTTGVASGPVSFMTVYDAATEAIRQGGTRRGANMGILNVDHPDIEDFIGCKRDTGRLNNFNISVAVSEKFMEAVSAKDTIDLIHPRTKQSVRKVSASELFNKIIDNAHATGEPGIIFLDRINAEDPLIETLDTSGVPVAGTEDIEATNPCGEQPLGPGDACNLGSLNVAKFIQASGKDFDYKLLGAGVDLAVRFLDNIIEANFYPLEFIAKATLNNRRIGLGIMGWAEALIRLGIAYDSEEALQKAEELMAFIQNRAHRASSQLASERGNFPNWSFSRWAQEGVAMRNATVTTIAPTGTISIIADTTSGIEPVFAVSFVRRVLNGMELIDINPLFEHTAREGGFYSDELMARIAHEGSIRHVEDIPEFVRRLWVCSHDIAADWHVRMQAAFQKFTDCAVSKTINLPAEATVEDIGGAYWKAYELGLKGITVYRDTSRASQVLNIGKTDPLKKAHCADHAGTAGSPRSLPEFQSARRTGPEDKFRRERPGVIDQPLERSRGRTSDICPECRSGAGSFFSFEACGKCRHCGYTNC